MLMLHPNVDKHIMKTADDRRKDNRRHAKTSRLRKKVYEIQLMQQNIVFNLIRQYLESLLPPAEVNKIKQRLKIEHYLTETRATMKTGAELAREFKASMDDTTCIDTELGEVSNTYGMASSDVDTSVLDAC